MILGSAEEHFDALKWMVARYLQAGDNDTIRQFMQSDSMRTVSAQPVAAYRKTILERLDKTQNKKKADQ